MKKKIIILQGVLSPYRIDFFNQLSKIYETIVISNTNIKKSKFLFKYKSFKQLKFLNFKYFIGLINFINRENPDVILIPDHLEYISFLLTRFFARRKNKIQWIWYGSDIKNRRYFLDLKYFFRYLFFKILLKFSNDQFTFYAPNTKSIFDKIFKQTNRTFLVRNTIFIRQSEYFENPDRKFFLNIGSLKKRKKNNLLIYAFKRSINKIPKDIKLIFVGDGEDKNNLKKQVSKLGLNSRIKFYPGTYSDKKIKKYYDNAIASISYGQAGLTILQSFGHGVCFITQRNAISGGEISNIENFENGILLNDKEYEIDKIICLLANNKNIAEYLGRNAKIFYKNNATLEKMVNSIQMLIKK